MAVVLSGIYLSVRSVMFDYRGTLGGGDEVSDQSFLISGYFRGVDGIIAAVQ